MALSSGQHVVSQDVSSKILGNIAEISQKALTAQLAAGWVSDLEASIQQTKSRIHGQIRSNLPQFEQQLESSRSVQARLIDLSANVDRLSGSLSNPETGLLPNLLKNLQKHSELAQRTTNARHTHDALAYATQCCGEFDELQSLVKGGKLVESVPKSGKLQRYFEDAPAALKRAQIMTDMKQRLRVLKDRVEEQLIDAYTRSVRISSAEFEISSSVKVRQSESIISLAEILSCLSDNSRDAHLSSLRRDIIAFFIDFPLQQHISVEVSRNSTVDGAPSNILSLFPLPPNPEYRKSTLPYLRTLFDFLASNLFPALPSSERAIFPKMLYAATSSAMLRDVLTPSIPSSLKGLSPFSSLLQDAVQFEHNYRSKLQKDSPVVGEGDIETWVKGAAGHYGRKRRIDVLSSARTLILAERRRGKEEDDFRVEMAVPPSSASTLPEIVVKQDNVGSTAKIDEDGWDFDGEDPGRDRGTSTNGHSSANGNANHQSSHEPRATEATDDPDSWALDEGPSNKQQADAETADDTDAWGWGDDNVDEAVQDIPSNFEVNGKALSDKEQRNGHAKNGVESTTSDDSAWDDIWDEPAPEAKPPIPQKQPKAAKGLEKLSKKAQKNVASPTLSSHSPLSPFPQSPAIPSSASSYSSRSLASPRPESLYSSSSQDWHQPHSPADSQYAKPMSTSIIQKPPEPETYTVSGRAQDLIQLVTNVIEESRQTLSSNDLASLPSSSSGTTAGSSTCTLLLQAASSALDLYCAIYPVSYAPKLQKSERALRFSNDCVYISGEVSKFVNTQNAVENVREAMHESLERLNGLAERWFDTGVDLERDIVLQILARAEGFVDTGDQDRFDECEGVMSEVLRSVRTASHQWKAILPRTKYYTATGLVVDAALTKILADVLALPDIPEVDSRKLSELCRILNALEGLFVDADAPPDSPSMVVAYVPSWLKYSYLSELLEASIADLAYLFDEGALIDFDVRELVNLVRALFADTPLRANTIAKLQRGHPVAAE